MLNRLVAIYKRPCTLQWGIGFLVSIIFLGTLVTLVYGGNGPTDPTLDRIKAEKRIVIAIDPSFPPFASYGEPYPEGLDADLGLAIGSALDANVQFSGQSYDGLYDVLYLGHVDIVISALHPDPLRTDWVYFSAPYVDAGQVLVMPADTPQPMTALPELDGQVLAVEFGSEGDIAAREYLDAHPDAFNLVQMLSADEAITALLNGTADIALVDRISVGDFVQETQADLIISAPLVSDEYVIAIRRENWQLALKIEEILQDLREDGRLQTLVEKWLGDVPTLEP